jgi:hypothetical protein
MYVLQLLTIFFLLNLRTVADDYHEYQGKVNIPKNLLRKTVYYVYTVIQSNGDEVDEHVYSHTSDTNQRSMFIGQTKVQGN